MNVEYHSERESDSRCIHSATYLIYTIKYDPMGLFFFYLYPVVDNSSLIRKLSLFAFQIWLLLNVWEAVLSSQWVLADIWRDERDVSCVKKAFIVSTILASIKAYKAGVVKLYILFQYTKVRNSLALLCIFGRTINIRRLVKHWTLYK